MQDSVRELQNHFENAEYTQRLEFHVPSPFRSERVRAANGAAPLRGGIPVSEHQLVILLPFK